MIPEIFHTLPPRVKIFRRGLLACQCVGSPTATVTLPQARLNRLPAVRLDFQTGHAPVCFSQSLFGHRDGTVVLKPARFPPAILLQRPSNI